MLGKIFDLNKENEKRTIFRIQKTKDDPYARINKECLQNVNLSWKAKGLLAYMLSLPDDWVFHRDELLKHSSDGRKSLLSAIRELKNTGYLKIVAEKNISGRFVRWITCVFEFPQPKNIQNAKKGILDKNQNPLFHILEKPECGKGTPTNKLHIQTNDKETTTQQETEVTHKNDLKEEPLAQDTCVVFSLMEKLKTMVISSILVKHWLKKYGAEYVMEKVDYTLLASRDNPAAFLNRAIREDWKAPLGKPLPDTKKSPSEPVWPSNEENITWYSSLSQEEKENFFKLALTKNECFGNMVNFNGLSFLGQDFMNSTWFKMMMSLIGRAK